MAAAAVLQLHGDITNDHVVALSESGPDCAAVGLALPWVGPLAVQVQVPVVTPAVYLCYRDQGSGQYTTVNQPLRVYGLSSMQPLVVAYQQSHVLTFAGTLPQRLQGNVVVTTQPCEGEELSAVEQTPQGLIQSTVAALAPGQYAVCYRAAPESPAQQLQDTLTVSGHEFVGSGSGAHVVGQEMEEWSGGGEGGNSHDHGR